MNTSEWNKKLQIYIRYGVYLPLILRVEYFSILKEYMGVSYATHNDLWGHMVTMISIGRVAVLSMSHNKNLNSRSSINTELGIVHDALPQMMWEL